ncbi:MAG: sigma-54-dependent transcriptional regulator [Thermodesulfobacteriota bacterium]
MSRVLVIDDEAPLRQSLAMFLGEKGLSVACAASAGEGLAEALKSRPEVVILDIRLPDGSGLDLLAPLKEGLPEARVIMITAYHDMETTIEAMRLGAYDYIHKPLDVDELEQSLARALRRPGREGRLAPLPPPPADPDATVLVGKSRGMRQVFKQIGLLTANRATVLIQGETGTGKEVAARLIHERSPWGAEPFITVDCTTLVESLTESELFGHERGAFTGAHQAKKGRLESAGLGTIFFDEVGELTPGLQAKLLRFLERREFTRLGGSRTLRSEARILGATNRSLADMAARGLFRADLLYRLQVAAVAMPPLRQRPEDLEEMVPFFLHRINRQLHTRISHLEREVYPLLRAHGWPGNGRELLNVLTKAAIDSRGQTLLAEAVRVALAASPGGGPGPAALAGAVQVNAATVDLVQAERAHLAAAMRRAEGNLSAAARELGLSRPTLRKRLAMHGLGRIGV